jgi:hypothetical protein
MILNQEEQKTITELMNTYRKLHDEIARIEVTIKDLNESLKSLHGNKDTIINGISSARAYEANIIKGLEEKYGEGKLDVNTFNWVNKQ